jgi:chromosome partitioning protein
MAAAKKRGLGRGLDALLGGDGAGTASPLEQEGELRTLPIQQIQPGKYQPRRHWNEEALDELAASIKAQGLIQPVVVRAIVGTESHYDLLPGNGDLTAAELKLMDAIARESRLKEQLAKVGDKYQTILIDCPPSLHLLTLNALTAADGELVPVQCEYFALEGLSSLLDTVKAVRQRLNPKLEIEGLLRTMYDVRNNLGNEVSAQLTQHFGDKVLRSIIPRNVRLAEAPSHGQPIHLYDRSSRGAIAYIGLAGEIIRRERGAQAAVAALNDMHDTGATLDAAADIHQE